MTGLMPPGMRRIFVMFRKWCSPVSLISPVPKSLQFDEPLDRRQGLVGDLRVDAASAQVAKLPHVDHSGVVNAGGADVERR